MNHESAGGRFISTVMSRTLAYASSLIPEIADTPEQIDQAMREGYGWKQGPFELIERLGPGWLVARLQAERVPVPAFIEDAASRTSVA